MVLLIVDTQTLIMNSKLYRFDLLVSNIRRLLAAARGNGIEVIYIRHCDKDGGGLIRGTEGFAIYDGFKPLAGEKIYDKYANSAFKGTGLLEYLKSKNEKQLMVVGLQTDYCMDATVKCGFEHGFEVLLPEHTNSTFDNAFMPAQSSYEYYNSLIWNGRYARSITMEEALTLLNGQHNV